MYGYEWTARYGVFRLTVNAKVQKEIRPVFKEELDFFGMDSYWTYPDTDAPLLWAEGIRRYMLNGELVAEAKGGGFYTKPVMEVYRSDLHLQPVDLDALWQENKALMSGLEQSTIDYIRIKHDHYAKQGYAFVVAFSGGKDSLALLELVSRALSPDEFIVVFSNTGMELQCTLDAVETAKKRWSNLRFYEAKSHLDPKDSWEEFGPPGRRLRWCCQVHKSVPTILKLREITGDYDVKAVVFDGVRAEESAQRAGYDDISVGVKNVNQINCSPVLKWNTAELYVFLLHNEGLINKAYRMGLFRVGCMICPMSSFWWDGIANSKYGEEMKELLEKIELYAALTKPEKERTRFIEQGGWKARMGGRGLQGGGNRIIECSDSDTLSFRFTSIKQRWLDVAPILGPVIEADGKTYFQNINRHKYAISLSTDGMTVSYSPIAVMDRFTLSHLRGVANKVAYCIGCKACIVQCPTNAFCIDDDGKINIREDRCVHCSNCIEFTHGKGCLVAKSLSTTGGYGMDLKGMNRYQHFGLRRNFLEHFWEHKSECFSMNQLGSRQYDALKVWLREAGLLSSTTKGDKVGLPTPLFEKLQPLGPHHPLVWAAIWTNLAYNSVICKWYMMFATPGEIYEKGDLVFMLGDEYSPSTRDNAVTALVETLRHSPIGSALKQGIPIASGSSYRYARQGWDPPEAVAIIYALYVFAEKTGRYTFTLSQLSQMRDNAATIGMDPATIFGLDPTSLKELLREIAMDYKDFIRVTFQADLDTVKLFPEKTSLDVLDLVVS